LAKTDSSTKKLSAVDKLTYEINTEKFNLESATKTQDKDEQISSFFAKEEQSRKEKWNLINILYYFKAKFVRVNDELTKKTRNLEGKTILNLKVLSVHVTICQQL